MKKDNNRVWQRILFDILIQFRFIYKIIKKEEERKISELKESKKIKIEEKIELKEIEMQADPCKNNNGQNCRYDCCRDCYDGSAYLSQKM